MTGLVTHFTDGFGPADFDPVDILGNDHFLLGFLLADDVIPDFDFDTTIQRPALFRCVAGHRLAFTEAVVGNCFWWQAQGGLEIFGRGPGAFPRQLDIVAKTLLDGPEQLQVVRMADKMQPHVMLVAHVVENVAQHRQVIVGDIGHTEREQDGRHKVVQLDRSHCRNHDLFRCDAITLIFIENNRVMNPELVILVGRQVLLHGLTTRTHFLGTVGIDRPPIRGGSRTVGQNRTQGHGRPQKRGMACVQRGEPVESLSETTR